MRREEKSLEDDEPLWGERGRATKRPEKSSSLAESAQPESVSAGDESAELVWFFLDTEVTKTPIWLPGRQLVKIEDTTESSSAEEEDKDESSPAPEEAVKDDEDNLVSGSVPA